MSLQPFGDEPSSSGSLTPLQVPTPNAHAITTGRIFLKDLNTPQTAQQLEEEQVKPLSQAEAAVKKVVKKIEKALQVWHQEWTEPLELTGKSPPIDVSLKNYSSVFSSIKELLLLYNKETIKLDDVVKLKILTQIRKELKQIQHTQIDFVHEQLSMIKAKVIETQKTFEMAKTKLLKTKDNLRSLTDNYRSFREAVARMRQVEQHCQKMTNVLIQIQTALPVELLPKPVKKGWFQSLKSLAQLPNLFPSAKEQLTLDTERFYHEYHALRQAVEKDTKTMSQLVAKSALKGTEISRCHAYFAQRLDELEDKGNALLRLLNKPFTERQGKPFNLLELPEYLDGKRALAFIIAVEENLPQEASKELRLNVSYAKKAALTALCFEGTTHTAESLYLSILDEEYAHELAAFHKEFQKQEVTLITQLEKGTSAFKIRALSLFFLALHAGTCVQSFLKIQETSLSLSQRAAKMKAAIEKAVPKHIQKAAGFIGISLRDKFQDLKKMNDSQFQKFTKKYPETREILNEYRLGNKQQPSTDETFVLMYAFQLNSIPHQVNPYHYKGVSDWLQLLTTDPEQAVVPVSTAATQAVPIHKATLQTQHRIKPLDPMHMMQTSSASRTHQQFLPFSLLKSFFGFLTTVQTPQIDSSEVVSPQYGRDLEYGSKYRNLMDLHGMVAELGIEGVSVPVPFGLASQHVEQFLLSYDSHIFDKWKTLEARFEAYVKNAGKNSTMFLQEKEVIEILEQTQKAITDAFQQAAKNPAILEQFIDTQALNEWLANLHAQGKYLMVRSTGNEDTDVANAGGNKSEAYISPTVDNILRSIGNVLASYFSAQSLQNLILAKQDPFKAVPPLAVMMQELIGESIDSAVAPEDIPVSCVSFSNEPYYSGSQLGTQFRVLRISCGFGHGEAVVTSRGIATDTVLVLQSKTHPDDLWIIYDNQEKPQRLAPQRDSTQNVELAVVENPAEIILQRTLDLATIRKIVAATIELERRFSFPVDSELVVKGNKIYFVQARPINRKEAVPTYIDIEQAQPAIIKTLQAKVIVPGAASALKIPSADNILMGNSLEAIEKQKLYQPKHALIIIFGKKPPSALSHSVVNFSSLAVPVLYCEDQQAVKEIIAQAGKNKQSIAVCMQEGTLHLVNDQVSFENFIKNGYVEHPAPISYSLAVRQPPILRGHVKFVIPPDLSHFLRIIRTAKTAHVAQEALDQIQRHPFVVKLSEDITVLQGRITRLGSRAPEEARRVLQAAQVLQLAATKAFQELQGTLLDDNAFRLDKLLRAKIVKGLLLQETAATGTVSALSYLSIQEAFAAADVLLTYQEKREQPALLINETLFMKHAVGARQEQAWLAFLDTLEKNCTTQQLTQFKQVIENLNIYNVLPLWMNLLFIPMYREVTREKSWWEPIFDMLSEKKGTSFQEILKTLLEQYDVPTQEFLASLSRQKNAFVTVKRQLLALQDQKTFSKAFAALKDVSLGFLTQFGEQYKKASLIGKLVAIQQMNDVIELYDEAIKTMKQSPHLEPGEKVELMREMLKPFYEMMKVWVLEIVPIKSFPITTYQHFTIIVRTPKDFLQKMMQHLEWIVKQLRNISPENDLLSTTTFSVQAYALGSGSESDYIVRPQTLEDAFTTIHQNCLACTGALSNVLISTESLQQLDLPAPFVAFQDNIGRFFGIVGQRIGVEVTSTRITISYNIPLHAHSAKLLLSYDESSHQSTVSLQVLGWNFAERFHRIAVYANMMHILGHFDLSADCQDYRDVVEIALVLPENIEQHKKIVAEFKRILNYSVSIVVGPDISDKLTFSSSDLDDINRCLEAFIVNPAQLRLFSLERVSQLVIDMAKQDQQFKPSQLVMEKLGLEYGLEYGRRQRVLMRKI